MEREGRRAEYAAGLRAEAERRFGAVRAEALKQTIDDVAGFMADVATFPFDDTKYVRELRRVTTLDMGGPEMAPHTPHFV